MQGERGYTVKELDALRRAITNRFYTGTYSNQTRMPYGQSGYSLAEQTTYIEELVRAHMLAGHTAEDLIASEQE